MKFRVPPPLPNFRERLPPHGHPKVCLAGLVARERKPLGDPPIRLLAGFVRHLRAQIVVAHNTHGNLDERGANR